MPLLLSHPDTGKILKVLFGMEEGGGSFPIIAEEIEVSPLSCDCHMMHIVAGSSLHFMPCPQLDDSNSVNKMALQVSKKEGGREDTREGRMCECGGM